MYGAILGDIIGSPYEFDRGDKTKKFPLFSEFSHYTDDSVLSLAVAKALLDSGTHPEESLVKKNLIYELRYFARKYCYLECGGRFRIWLLEPIPVPYNSYGNGSAMRVSAAGWLYDSIEETRRVARWTAEVTHNHPEGIKGAEFVASVIYLARTGHSKNEILSYVTSEFDYDLSKTCDEIRPDYYHQEDCPNTVPQAFAAFIEGRNYKDTIRNAVSLGGDCDTVACIAGSMAEAMYRVPFMLKQEVNNSLPDELLQILYRFEKRHLKGRKA